MPDGDYQWMFVHEDGAMAKLQVILDRLWELSDQKQSRNLMYEMTVTLARLLFDTRQQLKKYTSRKSY